jgi:hypothetical protein
MLCHCSGCTQLKIFSAFTGGIKIVRIWQKNLEQSFPKNNQTALSIHFTPFFMMKMKPILPISKQRTQQKNYVSGGFLGVSSLRLRSIDPQYWNNRHLIIYLVPEYGREKVTGQ